MERGVDIGGGEGGDHVTEREAGLGDARRLVEPQPPNDGEAHGESGEGERPDGSRRPAATAEARDEASGPFGGGDPPDAGRPGPQRGIHQSGGVGSEGDEEPEVEGEDPSGEERADTSPARPAGVGRPHPDDGEQAHGGEVAGHEGSGGGIHVAEDVLDDEAGGDHGDEDDGDGDGSRRDVGDGERLPGSAEGAGKEDGRDSHGGEGGDASEGGDGGEDPRLRRREAGVGNEEVLLEEDGEEDEGDHRPSHPSGWYGRHICGGALWALPRCHRVRRESGSGHSEGRTFCTGGEGERHTGGETDGRLDEEADPDPPVHAEGVERAPGEGEKDRSGDGGAEHRDEGRGESEDRAEEGRGGGDDGATGESRRTDAPEESRSTSGVEGPRRREAPRRQVDEEEEGEEGGEAGEVGGVEDAGGDDREGEVADPGDDLGRRDERLLADGGPGRRSEAVEDALAERLGDGHVSRQSPATAASSSSRRSMTT